jgi:CDK inhibitor PHO81
VLLCNDLGGLYNQTHAVKQGAGSNASNAFTNNQESKTSIKESARLCTTNNFMGLTCSSRILKMVPALIETVKQLGLVLVSDASDDETTSQGGLSVQTGWAMMPDGVNGIMKANGILRFNETVDM